MCVHKASWDSDIRSADLSLTLDFCCFVSKPCSVLITYIGSLIISSSLLWETGIELFSVHYDLIFFFFFEESQDMVVNFLGVFSRRLTFVYCFPSGNSFCPTSFVWKCCIFKTHTTTTTKNMKTDLGLKHLGNLLLAFRLYHRMNHLIILLLLV